MPWFESILSQSQCVQGVENFLDFPNSQVTAAKALKEDLIWPRAEREAWISSLPFAPSQEDFDKISKKLKDVCASVFDASSEMKLMKGDVVGDPMAITLKDHAKPFAIHTAQQIAFAQRKPVKDELDDMVAKKIVDKVGDVPTQ